MLLEKINKGDIKKFYRTIPWSIWVLSLIVLAGIFLRSYNFRDWLYFYPDQARDVMIVDNYLNGKIALPLLGFKAASTKFELGAMYYYFQIISGKIFGVTPSVMAYPDLFFNILSIPLLYYFFRKLFKTDISLVLVGLYAASFYAIEFSRFAWNPNSMPFFVLLFLLSLWKILIDREKTKWLWIISIGITWGISIQLHTILLYLFTVVGFACLVFSLKNNPKLWNRWLVVFLLVVVLNVNQLISETKHNFANTRELFELSIGASESGNDRTKIHDLALDVVCHAQANSQIVTSLGNKVECDFGIILSKFLQQRGIIELTDVNLIMNPTSQINAVTIVGVFVSLLFSILGYGLLAYSFLRESDPQKKTLFGLIILYVTVSFFVLFPVIGDAPLRYYLQLFFVPFLFLGFFWESMRKHYPKIFLPALVVTSLFFIAANFDTIFSEAQLYASQMHSEPQYVVLGELENMTDYVKQESNNDKEIYMIGDGKYMQNYYKPFLYTFLERNISLRRELKNMDNIPINESVFYIGAANTGHKSEIHGFTVLRYKNFGEIGIYILNTKK